MLAGATGLMACIGTAYSWSLFTRPLMAFFGWSSVQVSFAFALMVFGLGIGALLGGVLHDRYNARVVGVAGGALWGVGFLLAGLGLSRFGLPWLYATYGLLGGCGAGMAYVVPGACATRWFGNNRGLANGIIMLGFGTGSLLYNAALGAIPAFVRTADLANHIITVRNQSIASGSHVAFTPLGEASGISVIASTLVWSGIVLLVAGVLCGLALAPAPEAIARKKQRVDEYPPQEMLRTSAFYVVWGLVFVDCFAGLALLGNAVPLYSELTGATATAAVAAYGWLSIFNGVGRLAWAWISDATGRIVAFAAAFALQAVAIFALAGAHTPLSVGVAFALMLSCYGGILAIAPAVMADYYGTRYIGEDYGYVITAASIAGLAGPPLFSLVEDLTGSVTRTIVPIALIIALTAVLPFAARRPRPRADRQVSFI